MEDVYKLIKENEGESLSKLFTVLDGDYVGEKALLINRGLVFDSTKDGFLSKHRDILIKKRERIF